MNFKCYGILFLSITNILFSAGDVCVTNEGENGLCKQLRNCISAQELNRTQNISPTICGYINDVLDYPVVCCTDINMFLKPYTNDWYFPGTKMFEKKCQDYRAEIQRLKHIRNERSSSSSLGCNNGTCNLYAVPYVVGGTYAAIDEFPHMAEIGWERVDGSGYNWKCGGSLISEDFVLTAAHCLYLDDPEHKNPEPVMIRLGGSIPIMIKIASIIPHPDYKAPKKYNDIALIQLSKMIEFNLKLRPACLLENSTLKGTATTIGWGATTSGGERPDRLQKVDLNIFDQNSCKKNYPSSKNQPQGIVDSQFCAGYELGGRDACQGDSGGPIQVGNLFEKDTFDIIGITSFGNGCGSKHGGVYTKISYYIDWIGKYVWPQGYVLENIN